MSHNCAHYMMVQSLFQFMIGSHFSVYFRKFKNIKKYHHFQFKKEDPGVVFYKQFPDSTEERFTLLRAENDFLPAELPTIQEPKGLDHQWQMYLFNEI